MKKPQIPTNCCGNMCRDCVWNDYFKKLDKYEKWSKQNGIVETDTDPNASMFARLEKQILQKERLKEIARAQQKFGRNVSFEVSKSRNLQLYLSVLKSMEKYKDLIPNELLKEKNQL